MNSSEWMALQDFLSYEAGYEDFRRHEALHGRSTEHPEPARREKLRNAANAAVDEALNRQLRELRPHTGD